MAFDVGSFLGYQIWNNSGRDYLVALILIVGGMVLFKLVKNVILLRLKSLAQSTETDVDDLILNAFNQIHWPLYLLISADVASRFLELPELVTRGLDAALVIGISYYAAKVIISLIDYATEKIIGRWEDKVHESHIIKTAGKIAKIAVWIIAFLMVLSNLGYNVTTLIAGLGIGGLAIAFAFQKVLEDIFSSIAIYLDRPFEVGDFVVVGAHVGVVKKIGVKTTRIQALQGEEIVISNRELTSTRIENFKKMKKRRVSFKVGVTYDTANAKLKKALGIVAAAFDRVKAAELDRVHFKEFGDFNLNFEIVYYVNSSDYAAYMDARQEINLAIKSGFEKEKIEFAFPTQTIHLEK